MSKSRELKPCPFCGSPARAQKNGTPYTREWYEVICEGDCCDYSWGGFDTGEQAENHWNTRVTDAEILRLRAEVERLTKHAEIDEEGLNVFYKWLRAQKDGE